MSKDNVRKIKVHITTVEKVVAFTQILSQYKSSCQLRNANNRNHKFIVDAKSIMGIFSLNLLDDFYLYIYEYNNEADEIINSIKEYIVN